MFNFPDPNFYDRIINGEVFNFKLAEFTDVNGLQVCAMFKSVFNVLALQFSPHGSARIQSTQVTEMQVRFRAFHGGLHTCTPIIVTPSTEKESTEDESW